jgi:hypothetical protein
MMRRYGWLFLFVLTAAGIAAVLAKRMPPVVPETPAVAAAPFALAVRVLEHDVVASTTSIPVGVAVRLMVTNATSHPMRLRLAGYEDRVDSGELAAGDSVRIAFLADRPGDRFAWLVGEEPRGRLDVTGSHLVEGHR